MSRNYTGIKILSWNVGGAKFLKLPKSDPKTRNPAPNRHEFRCALNKRLEQLLHLHRPDFVLLQEIVQYECYPNPFNLITREWEDYYYLPVIAIDTLNQNHPLKWKPYREEGAWSEDAYLAQGYGLLWKKKIYHCPIFGDFRDEQQLRNDYHLPIEIVHIDTGLYRGDRDTEPRLAVVAHFVLSAPDGPIDVFLVNLHLTTLKGEREGVLSRNREGRVIREKQLDLILDGIVSRYNQWWNERIDDWKMKRHKPVWILGGDFNCLPDSDEIRKIRSNGFFNLIHDHQPTKASGLGSEAGIILDYLFAGLDNYSIDATIMQTDFTEQLRQVSQTVIDGPMISDHRPISGYLPIKVDN